MCGQLLAQESVSFEQVRTRRPPRASRSSARAARAHRGTRAVRGCQVLPHLSPSTKAMQELDAKRTAALLADAKKIGAVNLGGGGGGGGGGKRSLADFGSLDDGGGPPAPAAAPADEAKKAAAAEATAEEEVELTFEQMQPLGLLRAVLKQRDWPTAKRLMDELDGVDVAAYRPVGDALCGILDWVTAAAYASINPAAVLLGDSAPAAPAAPAADGRSLSQAATPHAAVFAAVPLLQRIGVHLHHQPLLLARMCRLCVSALDDAPSDARLSDAIDACVDGAILPALTLVSPNPGLVHELWRLLEKRPYTARYRSYGVLHAKMREDATPELAMARARTSDETKRMMRRLSKENTKQYGRHLGKITHCVPTVVFDTILGQIQVRRAGRVGGCYEGGRRGRRGRGGASQDTRTRRLGDARACA